MRTSPASNRSAAFPPGRPAEASAAAGFTLIEMSLALVVVGLLAALSLPYALPDRSTAALRVKALEIAAILRADRNQAVRSGRPVSASFDGRTGTLRSGWTAAAVRVPPSGVARMAPNAAGFDFAPDGRSSGGRLILRSQSGLTIGIDVNPLTSAVEVTGR